MAGGSPGNWPSGVAGLKPGAVPDEVLEEAWARPRRLFGRMPLRRSDKALGPKSITTFCAHDGGGQPEATIIATGQRTLTSRAALANGTMALGFEFADFGSGSRPYPFAVTAPLALAESRHRSGEDLALGDRRRLRGHGPSVRCHFRREADSLLRAIGRTAPLVERLVLPGCSGCQPKRQNFALGLGCAFTGGTFQGHEEGSWQRSLNGGMASERAVTAALLAQSGFRASELGLEGTPGLRSDVHGGNLDPAALLDGLGDSWFITRRWIKRYPMNTTLHAPVEALLQIMRENELHHGDIIEIEAAWQKVEPFLAKRQVSTVVSAQASLPFALAVAAVREQVGRRRVHRGDRQPIRSSRSS